MRRTHAVVAAATGPAAAFLGVPTAARVQLWDCNGSLGQTWKSTPEGTLVNPNSGRCLDVADGGIANGTKVQIHTCNGTAAQVWKQFTPA
ncbi:MULTISPECIES: RICIN domain-containing protein [Streptomyces]|uniref:RICIN domain-containing protein n=1 Tax=Streptomyces fimbriatus TaxID=68197 RepID=A0ABW0DB92_STRFI